jgi:hypothetical protein
MTKFSRIRENLLVQNLDDEILIYDKSMNKSYCLNKTARTGFNACGSVKTFAEVNLPEDIIYLTLDELRKQNLLESNYTSPFVGMNRREAAKKVGLASMVALPLILSLIAPSAVTAASGCAGTCIGPGGDVCQGRGGGSVRFNFFNSFNGTCSGPADGPATLNCSSAPAARDLCLE